METLQIQVYPKMRDSDVLSKDDYSHLLYSRGFQVTREVPRELPDHWRKFKIGQYWIACDSRSTATIASEQENAIAVIGEIIHLDLRESTPARIVLDLFESWKGGELDSRAQYLSGRYVLLMASPDGLWIQTDATGMRSVYYATSGGVAASHARLVASLVEDFRPSSFGAPGWFRETGARAIPGRQSEYASVSMLTPNTKINLDNGSVVRIPSASPSDERPSGEIADAIIPLAHAQFESLVARNDLLISLTAGLDSRTTLAMSRSFATRVRYFSYMTKRPGKPSPSEPDLVFARELCRAEGLDFIEVNIDGVLGRGPLWDVMRQNSARMHVPSIAAAYMRQLPSDVIHVRSNLYEIGRALIRGRYRGRAAAALDAGELARRIAGNVDHPTFAESVEASGEWLELTEFRDQSRYDELDLYYWELLMGKWLPAVMIESDVAHDTYTVINSRHILDLMLSAPLEERLEGSVAKEIISRGWPSLLSYPINGHKAK